MRKIASFICVLLFATSVFADTKISAYPAATNISSTDLFVIAVPSTANKKLTFDILKAVLSTNFSSLVTTGSITVGSLNLAGSGPGFFTAKDNNGTTVINASSNGITYAKLGYISPTNTYGSAVLDFSLGQDFTTNMAGNIAFTGVTGVKGGVKNYIVMTCLPNGADRTVLAPPNFHPQQTVTVTNGTTMDAIFVIQPGVVSNVTYSFH